MASPTNRTIVAELGRFDRLLEVGIGRRSDAARALAARGCEVLAIDVDETVVDANRAGDGPDDPPYRTYHGDVVSLADAANPIASLRTHDDGAIDGTPAEAAIDAVYARNLPAELQRPTVELAERLDAACVFTTLGFEEPIVRVRRRRSPGGDTLYVAREPDEERPGSR